MCVFERMNIDVPVPQHACGHLRSTLGIHVCLPPCLRQFYFDAACSRLSESPLMISLPLSTVLPQEYWNYRLVGSRYLGSSTVLMEPSPFNDVQASPIHKTLALAIRSCHIGDKGSGEGCQGQEVVLRRESSNERMAGEQQRLQVCTPPCSSIWSHSGICMGCIVEFAYCWS